MGREFFIILKLFFRGLKYLTIKVKEIVCRKGCTNYKEVAEILLNVLNFYPRSKFKTEDEIVFSN